jgi:endonuclease/exonuclease/phosphatase family metal-dependent hydrolase
MALKLLSLNIEGDNHWEKIIPFVKQENPDVLCLQEVYKVDLPAFAAEFSFHYTFVPLTTVTTENPYRLSLKGEWGIAILSKHPFQSDFSYYVKHGNHIPEMVIGEPNSVDRAIIFADVEKDNKIYRVATTHFTWADNGGATEEQAQDLEKLLTITETLGEHVLCGDFNAPRGLPIFSKLAATYTDNIPADVTTSLDNTLHRAGDKLKLLMVDGLFTTLAYKASNVSVLKGLSDHCAVIGEIYAS